MANTVNFVQQMGRNVTLLKRAWNNKAALRTLLSSENFVFVRDYPPGHFYSPLPDLGELREHARTSRNESCRSLPAIELNESRQLQMVDAFSEVYNEISFPEKQTSQYRYFFDNPFFSYGDGTILCAFLRHFKPKRVIEVGSGFSSAEMLDVNDRFHDQDIEFTFIEPYPERLFSLLSQQDKKVCHIEMKPVQQIDLAVFGRLAANDILFVDSSHVGKINSDVLHILFHILPLLKTGVMVHFHDIVWPFEYPRNWLEEGRAWNEAYFLRAFLQYNPAFEILFSIHSWLFITQNS